MIERYKHPGQPRKYLPDELWVAACEYFQWVEENPLKEAKAFSTRDGIEVVSIDKMQAMTMNGLYIHLNISADTFLSYEKTDEYVEITTRIRQIIYNQKFTGAAADLLNANIIARELGLAEKTQNETVDKTDFSTMTDAQLELSLKKRGLL